MDLYYIDHLAVCGRSWLHRLPAAAKLAALVVIVGLVLALHSMPLNIALFIGMLALAVSARLPLSTMLGLTMYPLIFLTILFLSIERLTFLTALTLAMRVLAITASVILLVLTTSFPALFGVLGRVLPGILVAAFFFTYRSLFILSTCVINARTAVHLRGGLSWRHPGRAVTNLGRALAHVLVHAIEMSQRIAENLVVRGYSNRIYYLGRRKK